MSYKSLKFWAFAFILSGIAILQTISPVALAQQADPTAADAVQSAWDLAKDAATYHYTSDIKQTTYPAPAIENIGKPPRVDNFLAIGEFDQIAEKMSLELTTQDKQWVEVEIDGLEARGRTSVDGEWESLGSLDEFLIPGGDPLGFLAGATYIKALPATNSNGDESLSLYAFSFSGYQFGRFITDEVTQKLIASGTLMPDHQAEIPPIYHQMTGSGEIAINSAGYPTWIKIDLDIGTLETGEEATIDVFLTYKDFSAEPAELIDNPTAVWFTPQTFLQNVAVQNPELPNQVAITIALLLFSLALSFLVWHTWRSQLFYKAVAGSITVLMLAGPFLQVASAQAYHGRLQPLLNEPNNQTPEEAAYEAIAEHQASDVWHPQQDPLTREQDMFAFPELSAELDGSAAVSAVSSNAITSTVDTDGDGVSDVIEESLELCSGPSGTFCAGVTNSTDSDGDGLTDGEEVNQLGTLADHADTDHDGLSDYLEVKGFSLGGQQWHLDPNQPDTNSDGLLDSQECPIWVEADPTYDANGVCPDSDNNGTPDVFDHDNDGDSVPDAADVSPNRHWSPAGGFSDATPFELTIDELTIDKPTQVQLQIVPTNRDNLYNADRVFDWPSPDLAGQIQRRFTTTFATTTNPNIRDTVSYNSRYGDVRITPLLEIKIPAAAGHYGNLPVKTGMPAQRTSAITSTQWLDTSKTDPLGLSVLDNPADNSLTVFVPVQVETDRAESNRVAFRANMMYYPSQGNNGVADWGAAHEYRLIWLVQMITETCTDPTNNSTCTEELKLVHIYNDEFNLTGLNVQEEHGLSVAVMYENPSTDSDRTSEDSLWQLAYGLGNTFLRGRDCDSLDASNVCQSDGNRDVTIANMATFVGQYDLDTQPVSTAVFNYEHTGFLSHIMMTETKKILNTHFDPYKTQMNPTILFAQEQDARALNLESFSSMPTSGTGITVTMSATNAPRRIIGGMSWGPFTYNTTTSDWESMNVTQYVSGLKTRLQQIPYFQPATNDLTNQYEALGRVRFMQAYYLSLVKGTSAILSIDGITIWSPSPDVPEYRYGPETPGGTFSGATYTAYYTFLGLQYAYGNAQRGKARVRAFLLGMGKSFGEFSNGHLSTWQRASTLQGAKKGFFIATNAISAGAAAASFAGVVIFTIAAFSGDQRLMDQAVIVLNVTTAVSSLLVINSNISYMIHLNKARGASDLSAKAQTLKKGGGVNALTTSNLVMQVATIWAFALITLAVKQIRHGTILYDLTVANAIAQTMVAVIVFAFGALVGYVAVLLVAGLAGPLVGTIAVMVIYLVDALVYLVTLLLYHVFGVGRPFSILEELAKVIAEALYDIQSIVTNLNPNGRLQFAPSFALGDDKYGFTLQNTGVLTFNITNTITFNGTPNEGRMPTFRYRLGEYSREGHAGLAQNQMLFEWRNVSQAYNNTQNYTTRTLTTTVNFANVGAGRDRVLNDLYLIESFAVPTKGCWTVAGQCTYDDVKDSIPINIGASQAFDILPNTIAEFANWYSWLGDGNAISPTVSVAAIPVPIDYDNDQVIASLDGDDTRWDMDSDGLTDYYELTHGTDPGNEDTDEDGLSDAAEIREGTDPRKADTDGDGLNDYIETVEGWLIPYAGGTTRIWSNPFLSDADGDKLSDLEEYMFGFNPYVHTDPSLIDTLIQIDDFTVNETKAPILYLPFDESTTADVFTDLATNNLDAVCDRTNGKCPQVGVTGRYGNAILLDGSDDSVYIEDNDLVDFGPNDDFTVAVWVKVGTQVNTTNPDNDIIEEWGTGTGGYPFVIRYLRSSGTISAGRYDEANNPYINSTTSINDGDFHHIAFTRLNGTLSLYIDGQLEGSMADSTTNSTANTSRLHIGSRGAHNYFAGAIDELVIYDRGMTAAQVQRVQAGEYNFDDLVVSPGDNLQYSATVTNTNAARGADGLLFAESTYISPTIPIPETRLEFEVDETRTSWGYFNGGGTLTCATAGAADCPAVDNGVVTLDGADDHFDITSMSATRISFDVNLDRAPAVGEKMYVLDSAEPFASQYYFQYVDIYFEYDTATTARLVMETRWSQQANDEVINIVSYPSFPINTWRKVEYTETDVNGFGVDGVRIYDQAGTLVFIEEIVPPSVLVTIGPGAVGNSNDGSGGLDGQLDNLNVQAGTFYQLLAADFNHYPEMFQSKPRTSSVPVNAGECAQANCPTLTRTGQFDSAVNFNNDTTKKIVISNVNLSGDFTLSGWFNANGTTLGFLANTFADAVDASSNTDNMQLTVDSGLLKVWAGNSGNNQNLQVAHPAGWNHFTFVRDSTGIHLYLNGALAASDTSRTPNLLANDTVVLGNFIDAIGYDGSLDEFAIFSYALDVSEIELLAAGKYPNPGINIANPYQNFNVPASSSRIITGTAQIEPSVVPNSVHRFDQTVDVAFDTTIPAVTLPSLAAHLSGSPPILHIHMPFEERPGHIGAYENTASVFTGFTCATAATCPESGVETVSGRGIYFDGVDDLLTDDSSNMAHLAFWVKPEQETGTIAASVDNTDPTINYHFDMSGFTAATEFSCNISIPYSLTPQEWTHIILGHSDNTTDLYVNGQLAGSVSGGYTVCGSLGTLRRLGNNMAGTSAFKGFLDDVRVYNNNFMNASHAQAIYEGSAPLMHFDFDEESDRVNFKDRTANNWIGTPTTISRIISGTTETTLSPAPGTDGKIGNIAAFNGQSVIEVPDINNAYGNLTESFTIMGWIKPISMTGETGYRMILAPVSTNSDNGIYFGTLGDKLGLSLASVADLQSTTAVNENLWQHVTVVYERNGGSATHAFYINGAPAGSGTHSHFPIANTDDPKFHIGGSIDSLGQVTRPFQGGLDELQIFNRALTTDEVTTRFLRDLRWYRNRGSEEITVDTDQPTVSLVGNQTYYENTFTMLAVNTFDPTSNVVLLDFGLKGPNDSTFSWHGAPPCRDGVIGRVWCPSFNPTTMGGEGHYQVQFRAVDQGGNETTSSVYDLYVDDTAPTAGSSHNGAWTALTAVPNVTGGWTLPLAGTISDSNINGTSVAGSGIVTDSVMIGLRASNGNLLSSNRQMAAVNGGNWSLTFRMTNEQPQGLYTVELQAEDQIGNKLSADVGTIRLDALAPTATVSASTSPTMVNSSTITPLMGTASDSSGQGVQSAEVRLVNQSGSAPAAGASRSPLGVAATTTTENWEATVVNGNDWSYTIPPNTDGLYEVQLRTTDNAGNTAEKGTHWRGLIDNVSPTITTHSTTQFWDGETPQTSFSLTFSDFGLDMANSSHPCTVASVTNASYTDSAAPSFGIVYQSDINCTVDGHVANQTVMACDLAGNCVSQMTANSSIHYVKTVAAGSGDCSDWANACTLQTALGSASSNDQIWVAAGVYVPGATASDVFNIPNKVAMYGGFAGNETVFASRNYTQNVTILSGDIDHNDHDPTGIVTDTAHIVGTNSSQIVNINGGGSGTILDGFTITGADGTSGALVVTNGARPQLRHLNLVGNNGGAAHVDSGSRPLFYSVDFTSNASNNDGAGIHSDASYLSLEQVSFSHNQAKDGGAIFNSGSRMTMTHTSFVGNQATANGGAIYQSGGAQQPVLTNINFSGNSATGNGGAIYLTGVTTPQFANALFAGNSAGGQGGAAYLTLSSAAFNGVTFSGNKAGTDGGALALVNSDPALHNSIVWHNQANGATGTLAANLYTSNSAPTVAHSVIEGSGGSTAWNSAAGTDNGNNSDIDPMFINAISPTSAPTSAGDYRLQDGAVVIDSGNTALFTAQSGIATDLAGNSRFRNAIDPGPYESLCNVAFPSRVYVNPAATGTNSGASWANAYNDLHTLNQALATLNGCVRSSPIEIWVAQGINKNSNATGAVLQINGTNSIRIYGGFNGTETMLSQRNPAQNITVLSADSGGDDITDSNGILTLWSNRVGTNNPQVIELTNASDILLDGFAVTGSHSTITGGGLDARVVNDLTVSNVTFTGNFAHSGSAVAIEFGQDISLINVKMNSNISSNGATANLNTIANLTLINVLAAGNQPNRHEIDISASNGVKLTNLSIVDNRMFNVVAQGLSIINSTAEVENSIIRDNYSFFLGANKNLFHSGTGTTTVRNSVIEGSGQTGWDTTLNVIDGGGNIDVDPQFVNAVGSNAAPTVTGDYRLQATSPVSNAGNTAVYTSTTAVMTDLDGNLRIAGTAIAIGAYEEVIPFAPVYTPSGANLLLSWADLGSLCHYNLYESTTPYNPPTSPTYSNLTSGNMVPDRIGGTANYFFKLQANCAGLAVNSAEVGVFNFSLTPGQ